MSPAGSAACLLCGSRDVPVVDSIPFRDLRHLFFDVCEIDIQTCIARPYEHACVELRRCGECGLEYYPPSLEGTAELYAALQRGENYYEESRWDFGQALDDIEGKHDLLEVGCGTGAFLAQAAERRLAGARVGLETNPHAARIARSRGCDVHETIIEEFALAHAGKFDVVCAFQVIEHVADPRQFAAAAIRCLRGGGLFILSVPNRAGFTRHAVNDFGNLPPHHLSRWDASVMGRLAAQTGCSVLRIGEEPVALRHREWYRDTVTVAAIAKARGRPWRRVELGNEYRLALSVSRRVATCTRALWRYPRAGGHSLYTALQRPSDPDSTVR